MPSYIDDDAPPARDRRTRRSPRGYDQDNDFRSPAGSNPGSKSGGRPRRDQYDASDEEDDAPKSRHGSLPTRRRGEPDIPHPPLGEDRDNENSKDPGGYSRNGSRQSGNSDDAPRPRRRPPPTNGYGRDDDSKPPRRSPRGRDDRDDDSDDHRYVGRRKPRDNEERYDERAPPPRRSGRDRPRQDEDGDNGLGRRRSMRQPRDRDANDDLPPRRKSLGRDFAPGDDPRRRRGERPRYPEDDGTDRTRPRRRRDDRPRKEDGYGTDRPRRRPRDDDHERGYRTDGRDARRERRKAEDRRDRDRDHRRDSARHHNDDGYHGGAGGNRRKGSKDLNGLLDMGKKHWHTVEPVAKPLLAQLAKTYLEGPGK